MVEIINLRCSEGMDSACWAQYLPPRMSCAVQRSTVCRYQLALSYVDEELMIQLDGAHADKAAAARSALLLNAAACELRVEDWHGAIAHCQEVRHVGASH